MIVVFPGATSAKVAALNNAPLAVVLPAEFTVTIPSGVISPTLPAKVMTPVPAVNVRFSKPGVIPSSVLLKRIGPPPALVLIATLPVNTMAFVVTLNPVADE